MEATIGGEQMRLLWQKALWLPVHRTLVAGDLHFGKVNHFRKAGIAVPSGANEKNTENLIDIINQNRPERVVFLGDLFHSHYNEEWQVLGQVLQNFPNTQFELVLFTFKNHTVAVHIGQ